MDSQGVAATAVQRGVPTAHIVRCGSRNADSVRVAVTRSGRRLAILGLLASLGGCLAGAAQVEYDDLTGGREPAVRPRAKAEPPEAGADPTSLAKEARLDSIVAIALARSPDLREADERVRENLASARVSGRLPDLELKYEQWGVPLARPYALRDAETLMLGMRQSFPALGTRDAEARAEVEGAEIAMYSLRAKELDLVRQVERTYFEYVLADREYRIHLEQIELTERTLDITRANFRTGSVTQQDVLRVSVELEGLHRDIARITQRKRSAAALLNSLMVRKADAPLGPAPDLEPSELDVTLADLEGVAAARRPERRAAEHAVKRSEASADAARRSARWPTLMVGVDYWFMPNMEERHAYAAMVSINLPWLNPRHGDEVRARERAVEADRHAAESVDLTVRYQVSDTFARYQAARETYLIARDNLVPAARQSFEAGQAGFASGSGNALALLDALRSLLEARLGEARALGELRASLTDLERAVGVDLEERRLSPRQGAEP